MKKVINLIFFLLLFQSQLHAQQPEKWGSSEIFKEIQDLNFLGSVLYVAAHPDDENTRLISYLSNHLHARTAYLSLTRGDGGQNLIGPELREYLGVIRTQELLAARKIDGGEQYFTRANDFGYSKNPEETLRIWNKHEILKDVVRTIREFKPDIIITRFKAESAGDTHGHHTSSAILSKEAFKLAGKENVFPEQAENLGAWQPKKLFFNTSPWFYGSREAFEIADKSDFLKFDTGVYYPLSGRSNTEIASLSRSQHQSQGFGSTGTRGKQLEYIEWVAGDHPKDAKELFAGINTTWSRVKGGKQIGEILKEVEENYDFLNPSASIPQLVRAYSLIQQLEDQYWKNQKSAQIKDIITASAGLYLEAVAGESLATPGEKITLDLEAINRSSGMISIEALKLHPSGEKLEFQKALQNNESWRETISYRLPEDIEYTSPYWLRKEGSLGMYHVEHDSLIGLPETPSPLSVEFLMRIEGTEIPFQREIIYKTNDPVKGETYTPFEIVPRVSVILEDDVLIFANHAPKDIAVTARAMKDSITGQLKLDTPGSWKTEPSSYSFGPMKKGEESSFRFSITAPDFQDTGTLEPLATVDGEIYSKGVNRLVFPHIPVQTLVLPSKTKLVKLDIQKKGKLIGYIEGAGDAVPQALEQIGYSIEIINPETISAENLKKYQAVVLGIRVFNVVDPLQYKQNELFEYVKAGGNLVVQYNTSHGLVTENLAPFPLKLSRDRVTDEEAEVRFLAPDHPVLNVPNKITSKDFVGWVQERGLYFPDVWSEHFVPILSMNDPGETPKNGSLLVAPYGKGHYIYTGLSFFREFPAGVPGAFRLFANLLSLGRPGSATSPSTKSAN